MYFNKTFCCISRGLRFVNLCIWLIIKLIASVSGMAPDGYCPYKFRYAKQVCRFVFLITRTRKNSHLLSVTTDTIGLGLLEFEEDCLRAPDWDAGLGLLDFEDSFEVLIFGESFRLLDFELVDEAVEPIVIITVRTSVFGKSCDNEFRDPFVKSDDNFSSVDIFLIGLGIFFGLFLSITSP